MTGELLAISIPSKTASLERCQSLHLDQPGLEAMLLDLGLLVSERAVLCTCERFEVYALVGDPIPLSLWWQFLAKRLAFSYERIQRLARVYRGSMVVDHILRVAAGLESRIVGEPHVLGQVRNAFLNAKSQGATGPAINVLGRSAIHCGKRVRSETSINDRRISVVSLTCDRLRRDLGTLCNKRIVIVGTGKLAVDFVGQLASIAARLTVVSQSIARARSLAHAHGVIAEDLRSFSAGASMADAIVTCTSGDSFVLVNQALRGNAGREVYVYDLGVPRNVDPKVAQRAGMTLVSLDELYQSCVQSDNGIENAEVIVRECATRLLNWYRARPAAQRIAEAVRRAKESATGEGRLEPWRLHRHIMQLKQETAA